MAHEPAQREQGAKTDDSPTMVQLAKRPDGMWKAMQAGLEIVGTGDSAARATEDMAGRIAAMKEQGER